MYPTWAGNLRSSSSKVQAEKSSRRAEVGKAWLFWCAWLLGGAWLLGLPEVSLDGEGIHTHGHGLAGNLREALTVRAVLVDALDHGQSDGAWPVACQARQFLRLWRQGVQRPELAARITEQDEEVISFALLHFLKWRGAGRKMRVKQE